VTQIALLDSQAHRTLRVQADPAARYGDNQRFVPVGVNEFSLAVVHYPILLSKDAETGAFYCGVMLGFDEGENLFLEEGRNVYRPLNLQRGPFYTVGNDIAIDLDHPRVGAADGQILFDEEGKPTPYLNSIADLMRSLRPGLEWTKVFVETLLKLKLVAPLGIDVAFDDGTKREVTGLYTIDQEALRGLADAAALDLFRRGYLHLIYLMIASLKQVPVLAQKKNGGLLR
jgi:SapC protein